MLHRLYQKPRQHESLAPRNQNRSPLLSILNKKSVKKMKYQKSIHDASQMSLTRPRMETAYICQHWTCPRWIQSGYLESSILKNGLQWSSKKRTRSWTILLLSKKLISSTESKLLHPWSKLPDNPRLVSMTLIRKTGMNHFPWPTMLWISLNISRVVRLVFFRF